MVDKDVIRGRRLGDWETTLLNLPEIPIWNDDTIMPLDPIIESKIQLDAIDYRVSTYYKTHDEEIQKSDDNINFALRMIGKATGFISEAKSSTGHIHADSATEMQAISKVIHLSEQSGQCLLMAANALINEKEGTDGVVNSIIDAAVKAREYAKTHPPIDYIDIGKKIGVSSTQGMELSAAMNTAYSEWKEKHDGLEDTQSD